MSNAFFEALANTKFELDKIVEEYFLYYDDNGDPICYSPKKLDNKNKFIEVDKETYTVGRYDIKVINGKLVFPSKYIYKKLIPDVNGPITCCKRDVSIICEDGHKWGIKQYE